MLIRFFLTRKYRDWIALASGFFCAISAYAIGRGQNLLPIYTVSYWMFWTLIFSRLMSVFPIFVEHAYPTLNASSYRLFRPTTFPIYSFCRGPFNIMGCPISESWGSLNLIYGWNKLGVNSASPVKNKMPGGVLLSHGETPHYHQRWAFSLLSSEWIQVVPARYCRQAKCLLLMFNSHGQQYIR